MKTKTLTALIFVLISSIIGLHGQDMFKATRLTFDQAQQGFPSWSPDGKYLIYSYTSMEDTLGKNGLWRITPDGKDPIHIFKGIAEHPKWSPDGRYIVFDADTGQSIKMIPAEGGDPVSFLPDSIQIIHGGLPCWSPDGSQIAFLEGTTLSIYVIHLETGMLTKIFEEEDKIPIPACWSKDGKTVIIALREKESYNSTIWKISSDGTQKTQIPGHREGLYRYIALSPDGSFFVYSAIDGRDLGLWIMQADGDESVQLVSHPGFNESPGWSPDGKKIAFTSTRSGTFDVWIMDVDMEKVREELKKAQK